MNTNIIIYGFGRMGLTHYAILNQLIDDVKFTFIDPDWKVRFFAQSNLKASLLKDDESINKPFDYALICTPPQYHIKLLNNCINRGDSNIFVEKPFGGVDDKYEVDTISNSNVYIGYVMRFNPIIQWIKKNIDFANIKEIEGSFFSNTIEKKPTGWRNSNYSGVLNEVGSHIIDLFVYLFKLDKPKVEAVEIKSVISDVDDIVKASLFENGILMNLHFDWVNKNFRKPVFYLRIKLKDGTIFNVDQQKIDKVKLDGTINSISVVDIGESVPYYLRGIDFTSQMSDLISNKEIITSYEDAMKTRNIISAILLR
jgi:predicted dehydrogenase